MIQVDWSKQHNGVHQGSVDDVVKLMPDLIPIIDTFPEIPRYYTWDVKVHMLMPNQFPCIPNWHHDMVPRGEDGKQDYSKVQPYELMYLWVSGPPLTLFKTEKGEVEIEPQKWEAFNQLDLHRGQMSKEFCWRGFIRAVPHSIMKPKEGDKLRRHSQVYLDSENFKW